MRHIVHSDTPEGFMLYYLMASGRRLPAHAEEWIYTAYEGRRLGKGVALEAFRGSTKTTVFTRHFTSYFIGLYPHTTSMFVQASGGSAKSNARWVANHIEHSPTWKIFFPHVVPDPNLSWSDTEGYYVCRTDTDYGAFRMQVGSADPTLLGTGYRYQNKLGKHTNGVFIVDDMNDKRNTRSPLMFKEAQEIHDEEMVPIPTKDCWLIYIFTPWVEGDIGDQARKNPNFVHCRTAVWVENEDGTRTNTPIWPEEFPPEHIAHLQNTLPPAVFAQMYLMDLTAAQGSVLLKGWWHWYPADDIKDSWPVVIGVDFASVQSQQTRHLMGRDHFALAVFAVHPNGKLILIDGWFGHVTQGQAEDKLRNYADKYGERVQVIQIEKLGKGESFANWALKDLPYYIKPEGVGGKGKSERFEMELGPVFRRGKVWVADDPDHEFISQAYDEWISWDGTGRFFDDCLDAMWHAINAARYEIWPHTPEELIQEDRARAMAELAVSPNPMVHMGFKG